MNADEKHKFILENHIGIPFTENNSVKVLKNGDEIFPAMLEAIKNAKEQIDFLTFVYWTGEAAQNFAQALAQKADEGLKVRVILDCYGAAFMGEGLADMMIENGVDLQWFRPLSRWKVWKSDNRTHRKVLICDHKIGFTGGVGIAEEWEGDARDQSEWRETHFRIEGRAVNGLQAAFLENWMETAGDFPIQDDWETTSAPTDAPNSDTSIQVIRTSASVRWSDIMMLYQTLIKMAEDSIHITTAYFNPEVKIINLLSDAVDRGVDVHIMMPGKHNDQQLAKLAGEETFEMLMEGGVQLWYYQKTMFHSKALIVDGLVSCIGSANFNHRSMLKDDEINLTCINEDLAETLIENFREDLEFAEPIDPGSWKKRSYLKRGVEKFVTIAREEI